MAAEASLIDQVVTIAYLLRFKGNGGENQKEDDEGVNS
jgi:hypothetical protein